MTKYLTSRLLIVFLIKFYASWASNLDKQLMQFFELEITNNSLLKIVSWLLIVAVIGIGVISINVIFTLMNLANLLSFSELIQKISSKGLKKCVRLFFQDFFGILSTNFQNEIQLERYPNFFLFFILIFLPFINGNRLLNNYYGIYKEYELEDQGSIEKQSYIVHKSKVKEINNRMDRLEENYDEDEPGYGVKKRGYLFIQAGLIDGYKTYYSDYKGLGSYIECLFFSAIEKLVNSIIYFFIPFLLAISIYHYRNSESLPSKT